MKNLVLKMGTKSTIAIEKVKNSLKSNKGEGYVDTGVKVLIAVVLGALLLGELYKLFSSVIMPTMETRVIEMFNYKG